MLGLCVKVESVIALLDAVSEICMAAAEKSTLTAYGDAVGEIMEMCDRERVRLTALE